VVARRIPLDCLIIGGGVAGLFILDKCVSLGCSTLLLESNTLGTGQTIHSHGIIHGNLSDASHGIHNQTEMAIGDMPLFWRRCLAGETKPDLRNVTLRSDYCHVWRSDSLLAKLGWLGVMLSRTLHTQPLTDHERPRVFQGCKGKVVRTNGQVIEPRSLLEVLSTPHVQRMLKISQAGVETQQEDGAWIIRLLNPDTGEPLDLSPKMIVLSAGDGNQALRLMFGLPRRRMKVRHVHMVMVRGELPMINGHCIDGIRSHLTISTTTDYARRRVWLIYSKLASNPEVSPEELILRTASKLRSVLPSVDLDSMEFTTYRTTRVVHGMKQTDISLLVEGGILTCWPSEMTLAPRLANKIGQHITSLSNAPAVTQSLVDAIEVKAVASWPRPTVALPPWETDQPWTTIDTLSTVVG